jgi:hypothetical protein
VHHALLEIRLEASRRRREAPAEAGDQGLAW